MMPHLTTPVADTPLPWPIDFDSKLVSVGSCFADEVGIRLQRSGFTITLNPFGILYNPASIATAIDRMVDNIPITPEDTIEQDGLIHSWHHHGRFSRPSLSLTLEDCNSAIASAHHYLASASLLLITFGTAWVYEYQGSVVANCHKVPSSQFVRRKLSASEIITRWEPLLNKLHAFNPALRIVFTVSPIRHLSDGAHDNQLSKSTLLLSIDSLVNQFPSFTAYFPAYEILLDELRDYRFYAPDMAHPSPLAADIIYHRFQLATMSPAIQQQAHNNAKQFLRNQHIPIHTI